MKISKTILTGVMITTATASQAHVSFSVNAATAGRSFVASASIPHGCTISEGSNAGSYDTYKVRIELPEGITARPMHSSLGNASIETSAGETHLVWEKPIGNVELSDTHFYRLEFRFSVPNTPLTSLTFRTTQYCSDGEQEVATVVWEEGDAPSIKVLPARAPGWNKYTAQTDISLEMLQRYFSDAQIVWAGNNAYSANSATAELITSPITSISAGTEYWVKY